MTTTFFSDLSNLMGAVDQEFFVNDSKGFKGIEFCSLNQILAKIKPHIFKNNFLLFFVVENNQIKLTVLHQGGEKIESAIALEGGKPQEIGASLSYFRRYLIVTFFNLRIEDGDEMPEENQTQLINQTQQAELLALVQQRGIDPKVAQKTMLAVSGVQSRSQLPQRHYQKVVRALMEL